jgi:hypothetical protein
VPTNGATQSSITVTYIDPTGTSHSPSTAPSAPAN